MQFIKINNFGPPSTPSNPLIVNPRRQALVKKNTIFRIFLKTDQQVLILAECYITCYMLLYTYCMCNIAFFYRSLTSYYLLLYKQSYHYHYYSALCRQNFLNFGEIGPGRYWLDHLIKPNTRPKSQSGGIFSERNTPTTTIIIQWLQFRKIERFSMSPRNLTPLPSHRSRTELVTFTHEI